MREPWIRWSVAQSEGKSNVWLRNRRTEQGDDGERMRVVWVMLSGVGSMSIGRIDFGPSMMRNG